jgi:hypothetical protein
LLSQKLQVGIKLRAFGLGEGIGVMATIQFVLQVVRRDLESLRVVTLEMGNAHGFASRFDDEVQSSLPSGEREKRS